MRYCGILSLPCAVLRYSYPPYAPLVIIVHLRRANFQLQAKVKLNCGRKVWDELCKLQEFSLGGVGRGLCERRVTRIFLVFPSVFFFSKLTLNSSTVQLPFTKDFQKKVVVSIISFTSKDCAPQQICLLKNQTWVSKIAHATNIQEIQPANISFLSTNVNSSLVCLKCWRAVTLISGS